MQVVVDEAAKDVGKPDDQSGQMAPRKISKGSLTTHNRDRSADERERDKNDDGQHHDRPAVPEGQAPSQYSGRKTFLVYSRRYCAVGSRGGRPGQCINRRMPS